MASPSYKNPLSKPLHEGWTREIVKRRAFHPYKKYDVYYYSPNGYKFRSWNEVQKYLINERITDYTAFNFAFAEVISEEVKQLEKRRPLSNRGRPKKKRNNTKKSSTQTQQLESANDDLSDPPGPLSPITNEEEELMSAWLASPENN